MKIFEILKYLKINESFLLVDYYKIKKNSGNHICSDLSDVQQILFDIVI